MFKKKPQIKNLSPLRSSERRKLADQIRKDYSLPDPPTPTEGNETQQTLGSLRNALLPESTSSAKFTTTHGPNSTLIAGTVYVGSLAGEEERILWFQIGKDDLMYPTVYTLWHNPDIVPLLHTGEAVVSKLKGGADLFAPGLIRPPRGFDTRAKKGAVVAVATHTTDTVPRWVGISELDINQLSEGASGTAARGLHWEGDEIWSWSPLGKGGQSGPDKIVGWNGLRGGDDHSDTLKHMKLEDEDEEEDDDIEEDTGGAPLNTNTTNHINTSDHQDNIVDTEEEHIPTTKEVDDAFIEAFIYSIYEAKKNNPVEPCGLDLPIQPSYLIANMIQPHLRYHSPHYTIKKTSWKNAKKFIKQLDKMLLVKSKDRNGGETVILDVDFKDQRIKNFQPYRLPKSKSEDANESISTSDTHDTSINQKLTLQILYRASSKLVPDLLSSKTEYYTSQQITLAIKKYIEDHPDLVNENKKRYVKLDPFLANNILGSNSSSDDSKALAAGEIDRSSLNRRILEDDHLCVPHHILLRNDQTYDPGNSSTKPRTGAPPRITLTIERRGGNKVVTAIAGLEQFFINPQLIKPELQKKCAGSASIGQLIGGKPGTMELQVQGDQRSIIEKEILGKRGVKPEWIDVIDKSKKKGKK